MSRKKTSGKKTSVKNVNVAAAALLLALPAAAPAAPALPSVPPASKCDAALSRLMSTPAESGWSSVIAHTGSDLTPAQEAQLGALKADVTRRLAFIGSVSLRVPTRNLAKLAALPFVLRLSTTARSRSATCIKSARRGR